MEKLLNLALTQGLGYALFVFLFFWVLKKQDERDKKSEVREEKYQETIKNNQGVIQELVTKFSVIEDVKKDVEIIKNKFFQ